MFYVYLMDININSNQNNVYKLYKNIYFNILYIFFIHI